MASRSGEQRCSNVSTACSPSPFGITSSKQLTLARDRAGEKPLYVAELHGGGWAFASEMKALLAHPDWIGRSTSMALEEFLAFDFVLAPRTILKRVSKLPAGCFATITANGQSTTRYWTSQQVMLQRSAEDVVEELDQLLDASVRLRMVADVPVGLFLSGGLDSTTIGWYMARHSPERSCIHHRLRGSRVRRVWRSRQSPPST